MRQLTSPVTSYDAIKYFTENAGTGIHPCVVMEIVLKWWSVRTDREQIDVSFITPLITTIQNISCRWYYDFRCDERFCGLKTTLDIPRSLRYICYSTWDNSKNRRNLKDCISKGDGTPAQLEDLHCSNNKERYRLRVPAFRYNAAVFPPYGDTKYHCYIKTYNPDKLISLITGSKEEILNYINNANNFALFFIPLPDTLQ